MAVAARTHAAIAVGTWCIALVGAASISQLPTRAAAGTCSTAAGCSTCMATNCASEWAACTGSNACAGYVHVRI